MISIAVAVYVSHHIMRFNFKTMGSQMTSSDAETDLKPIIIIIHILRFGEGWGGIH